MAQYLNVNGKTVYRLAQSGEHEQSVLIASNLRGVSRDAYGNAYRDHVLEMYKTYIEMADRISVRRERANSLFLSLNTAITALIGYVALGGTEAAGSPWIALVMIAGIAVSYLW